MLERERKGNVGWDRFGKGLDKANGGEGYVENVWIVYFVVGVLLCVGVWVLCDE